MKSAEAAKAWAERLSEFTEATLQTSEINSPEWVMFGVKLMFCHLFSVGQNIAYTTTYGYKSFRVVSAALHHEKPSVVVIAETSHAVLNQCPLIQEHMLDETFPVSWF